MADIVLSFVTAFTFTYFLLPHIIRIAKKKKLYDLPDERKLHKVAVPALGGLGIITGTLFSMILWVPFSSYPTLQYLVCSILILLVVGVKDDIEPIAPIKKLIAQILAASILVFKSGYQISSLYGVFGIGELPEWAGISFSLFVFIVIINAFNLIDGINGLSASIGILISFVLGSWFYLAGHLGLALFAFAMVGSLIAFLRYNVTPARIFMGDTGSLFLGLVCAVFAIQFIEMQKQLEPSDWLRVDSAPAIAIGILIFPLYDTLRVFLMRILRGRSPLSPDRNHIHHLMLDLGFTHMQTTLALVCINTIFILLIFWLRHLSTILLLSLTIGLATLLTGLLFLQVRKRRTQAQQQVHHPAAA